MMGGGNAQVEASPWMARRSMPGIAATPKVRRQWPWPLGSVHSFVALGASLALMGCPPTKVASQPPPTPEPLHVAPTTDLVPAPGLQWLLVLESKHVLTQPPWGPLRAILLPEERRARFAKSHGGFDFGTMDEVLWAGYSDAWLFLAAGSIDARRLEEGFTASTRVEGRALDRSRTPSGQDQAPIVRLWGESLQERRQLALLGDQGLAMEGGRFGPLRAAEAFAQGKLHKAKPALQVPPLDRAASLLGPAPFRAFAPGPFEGEWGRGLGGLLGRSSAAALSVHSVETSPSGDPGGHPILHVQALLLLAAAEGALTDPAPSSPSGETPPPSRSWGPSDGGAPPSPGPDPERTSQPLKRLEASYDLLVQSPLGRLCGLHEPVTPPRFEAHDGYLSVDVDLDGLKLARGLRAATEAKAEEFMAY